MPGPDLTPVIGAIPYRMALAGGWIDQPFVSRLNPAPPGAMVVACLEPETYFMERCGMATGTRNVALRHWGASAAGVPAGDPAELVRQLYAAENAGKPEPSGSQDMIGLLYAGISRLDYDFEANGGLFPAHIETCRDPQVARWLESVLHFLPVNQRPAGYNPLGVKNLDPTWIARLGRSGAECYAAILRGEVQGLAESFNNCMDCWEALLPQTVRHPTLTIDLLGLLRAYQKHYPGAMYSGCGGGYLLVVSAEKVPGTFQVRTKI